MTLSTHVARLAGAATLVALAACSGRTDGAANLYTFREGSVDFAADIGNRTLDNRVDIARVVTVRREDRLRIQFDALNQNPTTTEVEYTVEWFDVDGLKLSFIESWTALRIGASSVETLSLVAPTPLAVEARVQLRSPAEIR